jgi:hypothetical protein
MRYLIDTVPTLLQQMSPSDFLPLPCLRLLGGEKVAIAITAAAIENTPYSFICLCVYVYMYK